MRKPGRRAFTALLVLAGLSAMGSPPLGGASARLPFLDDFDGGLCTGSCPGAHWAIRQQEDGEVSVVPAPLRPGQALRASAAARRGGPTKADVVARIAPLAAGSGVTVAFDLFLPHTTPANSIQLVDLECATCGEGGNPGIRLYLRNGRLRIDRSKIGIAHAWTRDDARTLAADRWHHIALAVRIGTGEDGGVRVLLDGGEVLAARGATVLPAPGDHADRIQIGITANSNPVPVILYIDNVGVSVSGRLSPLRRRAPESGNSVGATGGSAPSDRLAAVAENADSSSVGATVHVVPNRALPGGIVRAAGSMER